MRFARAWLIETSVEIGHRCLRLVHEVREAADEIRKVKASLTDHR